MTDNIQQIVPPESTPPAQTTDLRIVLIGDDYSLRCYGPVLRRIAIGLIDEVQDLTLLCLETSPLLEYMPSPPVRIITETRQYLVEPGRFEAFTARQLAVLSPRWPIIDRILPQQRAIRLAKTLEPYKPTLLHALSERHLLLTHRMAQLLNIPYIVSILTLNRFNIKPAALTAAAILPCSSFLTRRLRHDHPEKTDQIHFLPIGAHVTADACCFAQDNLRPGIICCAPFEPGQGLEDLITAVHKLSRVGCSPLLTLSGQGPLERKLRQLVKHHQMTGQVLFAPPVEKVILQSDAIKQLLQSADIFVQPFPSNTWRSELLEAMSVGNAVIVADGKNSDLVIDRETARTYPFGNTDALCDTLNDLITGRHLARQLAQNAQAHLKKHFLASQMVERMVHAYRTALNPPVPIS